jgi:hypothetical protein
MDGPKHPTLEDGKENTTPQRHDDRGQLTSNNTESYVWRTQSCSPVLWFLVWKAVQKLLLAVSTGAVLPAPFALS